MRTFLVLVEDKIWKRVQGVGSRVQGVSKNDGLAVELEPFGLAATSPYYGEKLKGQRPARKITAVITSD
jgi:hypothetical protein